MSKKIETLTAKADKATANVSAAREKLASAVTAEKVAKVNLKAAQLEEAKVKASK